MAKMKNDTEVPGSLRIVIENVTPQIDGGKFPIKRVVGDSVVVRADVFADGHDEVAAYLLYKVSGEERWNQVPMKALGNDAWIGSFPVLEEKSYSYSVRGYIDEFSSWCHDLKKRYEAGSDIGVDLGIGAALLVDAAKRSSGQDSRKLQSWAEDLKRPGSNKAGFELATAKELSAVMAANLDPARSYTYEPELAVLVDRPRASFSAWYELFPRSWSETPGRHGTFKDCERILPEIAKLGFDVLYLAPIHPIGKRFRKGKNNSTKCDPRDPGSPWAVGSSEGGHKDIHPELGTLKDFSDLVAKAKKSGLEVALDIAFQCSPDHPYLKSHPEWFRWRPDGTVQYAENPPKRYEDIVPFNFDTTDRRGLWNELKSIITFWAGQGVRIFRVDNPHTKPFIFWDWLIAEVKREYPDSIFLAEAFTRPKVMYRLAKSGFTQSYTYFTWRNTKKEFQDYLTELTRTDIAEFFRPNFWPNTPDILAEHLQNAPRAAFALRAVMAATLSSNYGIYGPAFELCVNTPMKGKEEYAESEKYEIKRWDWEREGNIKDLLMRLNAIRRENPALQMTRNIRFCEIDNDKLLAYYKATGDYSNIIIVIVNLDPYNAQAGSLKVPCDELGIDKGRPYAAHDLLSGVKHVWQGEESYIELHPDKAPAHIIHVVSQLHRDRDFDYFL